MSRAVAMPSVDLTPDQLRFVESRVRQGRFDSAAAVVTAALHLLGSLALTFAGMATVSLVRGN